MARIITGGMTLASTGVMREGCGSLASSGRDSCAGAGAGLVETAVISGPRELLDRERGQVGGRVLGVEDLAVEEGLAAAAGAARRLGGLHAGHLGGAPPEAFL